MNYEEALQRWGASKLTKSYSIVLDDVALGTVRVEMNFNEGYVCCGGTDPDCYCSFAESPTAEVVITGKNKNDGYLRYVIDYANFDFKTVLKELLEIGGGSLNV